MKTTVSTLVRSLKSYGLLDCTTEHAAKELRKRGLKFSNKTLRQAIVSYATKQPAVEISKGTASSLPPEVVPVSAGRIKAPDHFRATAKGTRFVLTSAQNNSKVHAGFWASLQHFCKDRGAQLMVAPFTYNKGGWKKHGGITVDDIDEGSDVWYTPEVEPFLQREQIKLADGLVFCAELDILPTAVNPLGGLDNYTGPNSGVVPHAKMHMRSLATLRSGHPWKALYTTGTCTQRNYIERRAGQLASYHHVYGAIYVEIASNGSWFARQINAEDDGSFYELGDFYSPTGKQEDDTLKVINLGDIHAEKTDMEVLQGALSMLNELNVSHVVIHDLLDFENRNHHNKMDPFFQAQQFYKGGSVENNFRIATRVLASIQQAVPRAQLILVRSNHDMAFMRWLRENGGVDDPTNAAFYHKCAARVYEAIAAKDTTFDIYSVVLAETAAIQGISTDRWVQVREDDSYVLHGIELGLHGHLGPNGARGNPTGYRQLGVRANTGHTHSAGIIDGVWTAGILSSLDQGYNKGPSSWSHSHIVTHPNGKRQIITQRGRQWKA